MSQQYIISPPPLDIPEQAVSRLLARRAAPDQPVGIDALIHDGAGRLFVQKRSPDRKFLPGCWDAAGGHVEPGETLLDGLLREVREETGWSVSSIDTLLHEHQWQGRDGMTVQGYVVLSRVIGDLEAPRVEADKVSEWRWIDSSQTDLLLENRPQDLPSCIHAGALKAFEWLAQREAH